MSKTNKPLLLILIGVLVLTLSGCAKRDAASYQTPLNEVAYLADLDIKNYNLTNDTVSFKMSSNIEGKKVKASYGYYKDEVTKKEFVALKESEIKTLGTEMAEVKFDLETTNETENGEQKYLLISFGTSLDEDAKAYRGCKIVVKNTDDSALEGATVRYPYTMYFEEGTAELNHIKGLSAILAYAFGMVLFWITKYVCGGHYWLGLLIFTILIRTAGWPIYAKSNSTSQGMSKIQPEMDKINKKYQGRTDQNSQMKQQMEIRELMKKNKVSMWGCLLPFAQMPIFIIVYEMVRKFACTPRFDFLDYRFLWADLGSIQGNPTGDPWLAILVGVTMVATQLLSMFFQKRAQKKHENFYTRQNASNQKQANMTLYIMTGVMTVMMVVFAWNSAGMAFYWIIGNVYQLAQTLISKLIQEKKEEKESIKNGTVRGRV